MQFHSTTLAGVWKITAEPRIDERGFLARTYCEREFAEHGLNIHWPQCNLTRTVGRGLLRGLHFQADPHPETKLIRCAAGTIFDVIADPRPGSPTYGKWEGFHLDGERPEMLYVPGGYAHGFQCLSEQCDIFYQMSEFYYPDLARGIRWDDPTLNISWPLADPRLSPKDRQLPLLSEIA